MPKPSVNQMRDRPRLQPTMSLALLVQVGAMPGWPGASPCGSGPRSATMVPPGRPQLEAAGEGVVVVAEPDVLRQLLQPAGVAAAHDDVVGLEGRGQALDRFRHLVTPLLRSEPFEAGGTEIVLEGAVAL